MKRGGNCPSLCECHQLPDFLFYTDVVRRPEQGGASPYISDILAILVDSGAECPANTLFLSPLPRNRAVWVANSIVQAAAHLLNQGPYPKHLPYPSDSRPIAQSYPRPMTFPLFQVILLIEKQRCQRATRACHCGGSERSEPLVCGNHYHITRHGQ